MFGYRGKMCIHREACALQCSNKRLSWGREDAKHSEERICLVHVVDGKCNHQGHKT